MPKNPFVTLRVPKRAAFDKSHKNRLTGNCGTLIPVLCDEVIPGTKVNLKVACGINLPPLVSDVYMNVSYKLEAFFVPSRILFGGFEDFFTQDAAPSISSPSNPGLPGQVVSNIPSMPRFEIDLSDGVELAAFAPGTLADYLGVKLLSSSGVGDTSFKLSPMPFLAYHMIYEHWYRSSLVQQHAFAMPSGQGPEINNGCDYLAAMMPYIHDGYVMTDPVGRSTNDSFLADNVGLVDLRQRNFGFDYFTNGFPSSSQPSMTVASVNDFSIASLRASNSLQQFAELNQIAGRRLTDVCMARYGANLNSGVAQRPVFLGSASYEIYSHGVNITASNSDSSDTSLNSKNIFSGQAGGRVGNGYGSGSDYLIRGFECNEPGYIMVIGSLVPRACYGTGIRRYLKRYLTGLPGDITDFANPLLQNVGNDVIWDYELNEKTAVDMQNIVFGYTDKYASWFNYEDEVHGIFRDGETLEHFVLQRNFSNSGTTLTSNWLQIPTNFLDQVVIANLSGVGFSYMADFDFDYKVLMPMYPYSRPSLQDPAYEHGRAVTVNRGGFRF